MISSVLAYLFPQSVPLRDWELVDDDARGPRISRWNLPDPQPTPDELAKVEASAEFLAWLAAAPARALSSVKTDAKSQAATGATPDRIVVRALLALLLDQLNVLRAKAGLAALTAAQVKSALEAKIDAISGN